MTDGLFTREVLLDISVNVIPIAIMGLFLGLFLVYAPWGPTLSLAGVLQISLLLVHIGFLAALTYVAAKRIETGDPGAPD